MFLTASLFNIVLVLALNWPHSVTSQCVAYSPNRVSSSTFDTVFSVAARNFTGSTFGCFGVSGLTESSLCVYEIQGSIGQVVDVQITSFTASDYATLSLIDGHGVFGGQYVYIVKLPHGIEPSIITTSSTNSMGVVVDTGLSSIGAAPSTQLSFVVFYKIRAPEEARLINCSMNCVCDL